MIKSMTIDAKTLTFIGFTLMLLAIAFAFFTRLIAVFQYVTFDIGPDPDQIRDTFLIMEIWKGKFPTLGPVSSIGGHHILPLYYYLVFPFTILGSDPVFQALPNALFSFLSIPLFIYLIYQLLDRTERPLRLFLSGLAGFWYSLFFGDIFISNFQWNPSSIPFFFLLLTALYQLEMKNTYSFVSKVILWILSGVVLGILISLHSSTLFIIPLVFIITAAVFIYQAIKKKQYLLITLPFIGIVSAIISLTPYWIGEFGRNFRNTKTIIKTVLKSSSESDSSFLIKLFDKFSQLILNYLTLGQQHYLWDDSWLSLFISIIFLSVVTYLGFVKFKGNPYIWLFWVSTWLIFLLAAANIDPQETVPYYKSLISFAPIVLTVITLAFLDYSSRYQKALAIFIGIFIVISCLQNLRYDYRFMLSKYSENALMSTEDVTNIMEKLPPNATICDPTVKRKRKKNNQYNYIDTYVTNKGISVTETCQPSHYIIHPKRIMLIENNFLNNSSYTDPYFFKNDPPKALNLFPTFEISENEKIDRPSELFLETKTAYVYRIINN
ncbi:hypothetical protein cce_2489 [Crocosphaera subtropica ATCC 51142]|uniref:Glycosyltransferase RgtA/B/C/D-like domain-containing protein n=1 Tax=Crocosphaera subtropica (strain ATCC 51142 / BH68) TaxID=43989 RepID=B1WRI8_CROS5|nr:hypothetical protein [Crocosphaera subtropica]ACB51837.1 hypothetical protein cce_2489 [Crocosphaera subtropica ATCC 51142]